VWGVHYWQTVTACVPCGGRGGVWGVHVGHTTRVLDFKQVLGRGPTPRRSIIVARIRRGTPLL
jgi:hypothetical protein